MNEFKTAVSKLCILLFNYIFIYPAIILSLLVLGLTSSWKSGVVMLVSALLLKIVLWFGSNHRPAHSTGDNGDRVTWTQPPARKIPPPLSEIEHEINSRKWEEDLFKK
ncbi:hypothetical protein AB6A23_16545 [Paenibacillus tarimensis]